MSPCAAFVSFSTRSTVTRKLHKTDDIFTNMIEVSNFFLRSLQKAFENLIDLFCNGLMRLGSFLGVPAREKMRNNDQHSIK
jgi:hypothetical protein